MPVYTKTGLFTNGSAPGISAAFLNAVEAQLVAVPYGMNMLTTPPLLANNFSLASGTTNTYTCTAIGTPTIPSGIKAVLLNVQCTPSGAGAQTTFVSHGTTWAAGLHPSLLGPIGGQVVAGSFWVPVDGSGQIDVKGNFQNITGLYIGIGAYLY